MAIFGCSGSRRESSDDSDKNKDINSRPASQSVGDADVEEELSDAAPRVLQPSRADKLVLVWSCGGRGSIPVFQAVESRGFSVTRVGRAGSADEERVWVRLFAGVGRCRFRRDWLVGLKLGGVTTWNG